MTPQVGPFGDPAFWQGLKTTASNVYTSLKDFGNSVVQPAIDYAMQPAERASIASRDAFPGQPWDGSQRNALRHSLWVGGMAQAMGAGSDHPFISPFAQAVAQDAGYAHEGISNAFDWMQGKNQDMFHSRDTLHDLNNNAVGALAAGRTRNNEELLRALTDMAINARRGVPVGMFSPTDGRLSADQ